MQRRRGLAGPLTGPETDMLRLLTAGKPNQRTGHDLVVPPDTVKEHVTQVLGNLGGLTGERAAATYCALSFCGAISRNAIDRVFVPSRSAKPAFSPGDPERVVEVLRARIKAPAGGWPRSFTRTRRQAGEHPPPEKPGLGMRARVRGSPGAGFAAYGAGSPGAGLAGAALPGDELAVPGEGVGDALVGDGAGLPGDDAGPLGGGAGVPGDDAGPLAVGWGLLGVGAGLPGDGLGLRLGPGLRFALGLDFGLGLPALGAGGADARPVIPGRP